MKCHECKGVADNGHDREYPPNVYLCSRCEELNDLKNSVFQYGIENTKLQAERDTAISEMTKYAKEAGYLAAERDWYRDVAYAFYYYREGTESYKKAEAKLKALDEYKD